MAVSIFVADVVVVITASFDVVVAITLNAVAIAATTSNVSKNS